MGCTRSITAGSANSSTSRSPNSAPSAKSKVDATPEARFAPELFQASRWRAPRIRAAIALVVVFPFVAETSATPCTRREARASTAAGSSFQRSFPGSVVPPPRRAARDRLPTSRAAAVSTARRALIVREGTRACSRSGAFASEPECYKMIAVARARRKHPAVAGIDEAALAEFRAGLRRRYGNDEILTELRQSAARLGRSPTMREFAADPGATVHPQTVIEHFGTWNAAKRAAGLSARRFISRDELLDQLRDLGAEVGRTRRLATSRSGAGAWRRSP